MTGKIAVSLMRLMTFMETRVQLCRPSTSTSNTSAHLKVACSHLWEDNLKKNPVILSLLHATAICPCQSVPSRVSSMVTCVVDKLKPGLQRRLVRWRLDQEIQVRALGEYTVLC